MQPCPPRTTLSVLLHPVDPPRGRDEVALSANQRGIHIHAILSQDVEEPEHVGFGLSLQSYDCAIENGENPPVVTERASWA